MVRLSYGQRPRTLAVCLPVSNWHTHKKSQVMLGYIQRPRNILIWGYISRTGILLTPYPDNTQALPSKNEVRGGWGVPNLEGG